MPNVTVGYGRFSDLTAFSIGDREIQNKLLYRNKSNKVICPAKAPKSEVRVPLYAF